MIRGRGSKSRPLSFGRRELDKFQVMPPLQAAEYEKLKESIAEQGVLVPVEKDADTGEILDGFHRMRACKELGIEPPIVERSFGNDAEREVHALTLNLTRRQLGPRSWGDAFRKLLEVRGVKTGVGGDRRSEEAKSSDTVSDVAREAGVNERTARRRMKLAEDLEGHPEVAEEVDKGNITPLEGRRRVGAASPKKDAPSKPKTKPESKPEPRRETPEPAVGEILGDEAENAVWDTSWDVPPDRKEWRAIVKWVDRLAALDSDKVMFHAKDTYEVNRDAEHLDKAFECLGRLRESNEKRREQLRPGIRAVN